MPLSKQEFAALVSEMPDASDDEILAEAQKREASGGKSTLKTVWDKANAPLTTLPSKAGKAAADTLDSNARRDQLAMNLPEPLAKVAAQVQGFTAGALEGAGDVVSSLTSPLNLLLTATGAGGASAARKGMLGISKAARVAEAALQAPMVAEGAAHVAEGLKEGDYGKAGAGALEAGMGAGGMRSSFKHSFPVDKVAEAYGKTAGISRAELAPHTPVKVNPKEASAIADAYSAMPHDPSNPEVANSYKALQDEVKKQYLFIRDKAGLNMVPSKENYPSSKAMIEDVQKNNRLNFYPSEEGFGSGPTSNHPLLQVDPDTGLNYNDMFRAVHDYFGHAKEGHQFGPNGEENAWMTHVKMFSPEAQPAMTSETRGQNSWVNSGPHLRDASGNVPKKGQEGYVAPQDRPFAEQKAGLLPEQFRRRADVLPSSAVEPIAPAAQETAQAAGRAGGVESVPTKGEPSSDQIQGALPSQPAYNLENASSIVDDLTTKNGGASFNLFKGDLFGTPHYAVSVYPERGVVIPGKASAQDISRFVAANQDLLQDPKNSIGTWFNNADGKTYLDVSVTTPDLNEAVRLGKDKNQQAIFDLGKGEEISLQPPGAEHVPVGEEPPVERPTFKDPMEGIKDKIASQGGRDLQRVGKEQAARGINPGGLATASAIAAPAAAAAIPDDPDSQIDDYGRLGLNILGAAGLIGAAVRGRQVKELSPIQDAAAKGAAALWLGGKKAWKQSVGPHASPELLAASQKLLDRHLATTMNELPKTKKLLALNKAGEADAKWYDATSAELKKMFGPDAKLMANFFAATSNNATVSSNAALAMKAYRQFKMGEPFTGYLPDVIENLNRAAKGEPLNGRKIDNFAKALSDDPDAVVADRWIMRAFGFNKGTAPTDTQYDFIEHAIKQLAEQTGQTPRQVQAAIWFGIKNAAEAGKNRPPSPAPEAALQHTINLRHKEALVENRKFDKEKLKKASGELPF